MGLQVNNTAIKHDQDKSRIDLINPSFIEGIGLVLAFGAKKYGEHNYLKGKGLGKLRIYAAAMRHFLAWAGGSEYDDESGLSHLYHVGACLSMIHDVMDKDDKEDTAPGYHHQQHSVPKV